MTTASLTRPDAPARPARTGDPHLTRILLDPRTRTGRQDLTDATSLHRLAMRLAPEHLGPTPRADSGTLFRLDDTPNGPALLVQTADAPLLDRLADRGHTAQARTLAPLLDRLAAGTRIAYRIVAAPSKRAGNSTPELTGKTIPLAGPAADAWWQDRAARSGLTALTMTAAAPVPDATGTAGNGSRYRHRLTRFDGTATIADPALLTAALLTGIGRGKSHGAGLLTIAVLTSP